MIEDKGRMFVVYIIMAVVRQGQQYSESRPRKVELACAFKNRDYYREYFTYNNEACICSYENQPYSSNIH